LLLGSAYNRTGSFAEALKELQAAVQSGGAGEAEVLYHLARAHGGLGHVEERRQALADFSELTRRSRESADARRRAQRSIEEARSLLDSGDLNGAADKLEQARELNPGDATLLFRLAALHYDLKRLDTAREYVQAAISISPSAWLYHYLLGLVEKSSRRWEDARASLDTASRLNPGAAEVHNALGEIALELRDIGAAVAAFERASHLAPSEPAYRHNLEAARSSR
jgi:tetratricopeptide (TPR) repeat protein